MRREEVIADAAISLLVERGMRGLTHRAVDEAAGLPPGSTSNLARTRAALLSLTLARLSALEEGYFTPPAGPAVPGAPAAGPGTPASPDEVAGLLAGMLHHQLTTGRRATLARYELALEATRRPELRQVYDAAGRHWREV
ncbi:TetR/AcrR family transcriptional regulator, partial [Sphaerisporangium rufum]|uniref:TetR/AcrR family transcriptional regulator n=1 Tax=Sphaerisporangium rufum TaxID=1381558 RepID=UPI001EF2AC3D